MFALIEPKAAGGPPADPAALGARLTPGLGEGLQLRGVADAGSGAVAFEIADRFNAEAGAAIGPHHGQHLPSYLGPREAAAAVGRNPPTANGGQYLAAGGAHRPRA